MRDPAEARAPPPAVVVVIPSHNRLPLLAEAIASVLEQSFRDLELIVVDDGSTDDSLRFVGSIDDPRVRWVACEHSGNVARVRNAGAAVARAHWLCFLDSDDFWHPGKLERQSRETASAGTRWSYTRYRLVGSDGTPVPWRAGGSAARSGQIARALLADELGVTIVSVMVERALFAELGGFSEQLRSREDYEFIIRLALEAPAHAVDECLVSVRQHVGRSSSGLSTEQAHLDSAAVFGSLRPRLREKGMRRIARRRRAEHLAEAGGWMMRRGARREAAGCFARAVVGRAGLRRIAGALARGAGISSDG